MTKLRILWLCLVLIVPRPAGAAPEEAPAQLEGFDAFVTQVMADWQVPGLALAAVRDGRVVVSRVYGLRDPERGLPVTPRTLFAIGSVTKTFTATGLAILAEEGRLDWDRPVRQYLPDFALMDPRASREITPRDLVSHRSGLPRHDVLWYAEAFDRAEMLARLRHLKPTKALRKTFQYQNLMFMAAGVLAGRLDGTTWEDFTRRRLLDPLGHGRDAPVPGRLRDGAGDRVTVLPGRGGARGHRLPEHRSDRAGRRPLFQPRGHDPLPALSRRWRPARTVGGF